LKTPLLALLTLLLGLRLAAQTEVRVQDALTGEPLAGAAWATPSRSTGGFADEEGIITLPAAVLDSTLLFAFPGYHNDTLTAIALKSTAVHTLKLSSLTAETVVITGNMKPSYLSLSPIKTEVLTRAFLDALPAQTMIEAVDFVNGVNQQINCGVCGTNDIHINGMEGPYTLVLLDGMPIVSALGTVYGLNGIPSSMIERIEVVKGPGSTLYGAEAVAGVINVITRDPRTAPKLLLSAVGNTHSEWNGDFATSQKLGKAHMLFSGNAYQMNRRLDFNGDNFTDVPLSRRMALFNKWTVDRPHDRIASFAAKGYYENRYGGQMHWTSTERGSDSVYGESILTRRAEVMGMYDLPTRAKLRLTFSWAGHAQDSWYGTTTYLAEQHTIFSNLAGNVSVKKHDLLYGAAVRTQYYNDNTPATAKRDLRTLPGVFVQDEWTHSSRFTALVGLRADLDRDAGLILSPRLTLRWKPAQWTTLRLTTGSGFRTVNLFTEDHAALTGARTVVIAEALRPERSWNVNATWTQVVNIGNSAATFDADAFYTHFLNKIVPDYDTDPNLIVYQNLHGYGTVRGLSLKWSQSFAKPLRYEVGTTFMQVFNVDESGARTEQIHAPWFSAVFSAGYDIKRLHTRIDWNGKVTGPMRLPSFEGRSTRSDWWSLQHVQVTTTVGKQWKVLYGVKNLLNYTQPSPLIHPEAPFGDQFDTAYIYGPMQPRRYFVGLEWRIGNGD
jgi:outer membrane receptor for ferrienterochelin and colicins